MPFMNRCDHVDYSSRSEYSSFLTRFVGILACVAQSKDFEDVLGEGFVDTFCAAVPESASLFTSTVSQSLDVTYMVRCCACDDGSTNILRLPEHNHACLTAVELRFPLLLFVAQMDLTVSSLLECVDTLAPLLVVAKVCVCVCVRVCAYRMTLEWNVWRGGGGGQNHK